MQTARARLPARPIKWSIPQTAAILQDGIASVTETSTAPRRHHLGTVGAAARPLSTTTCTSISTENTAASRALHGIANALSHLSPSLTVYQPCRRCTRRQCCRAAAMRRRRRSAALMIHRRLTACPRAASRLQTSLCLHIPHDTICRTPQGLRALLPHLLQGGLSLAIWRLQSQTYDSRRHPRVMCICNKLQKGQRASVAGLPFLTSSPPPPTTTLDIIPSSPAFPMHILSKSPQLPHVARGRQDVTIARRRRRTADPAEAPVILPGPVTRGTGVGRPSLGERQREGRR